MPSYLKELSEEEDEIEKSEDSKKHKSKLKELGAAIQKLLKKHDDDDEVTKGGILDDQKVAKIENVKERKLSNVRPKNATIEELTGVLVKAANTKHKIKNTTTEEIEPNDSKNEVNELEGPSFIENGKSHEKGDKILQDLGLMKKKKGLPLASAVARGDKPPCICPDKGKKCRH